ncbi:MAG: hypothetical protein M3Y80_07320 [Verrucomicrobiota bacterium]|nr:hypothetical protein [Verrucomicrobiota bacterium]
MPRGFDFVETNFEGLLQLLVDEEVEFILIGGLAAIGHGLGLLTHDIDIVYRRSAENFERLVRAVAPLKPYLRGGGPDLPFRFDVKTLKMGLNFTLRTTYGDLDLLGEVSGGGFYDDLVPFTDEAEGYGRHFKIVQLDKLIALKRAAGRPKDKEAIAQLEALRQEKRKLEGTD